MWKLVFGAIILLVVLGAAFFIGFIVGTTVTPLPRAAILPVPGLDLGHV
ncbi:hypothetical protein ACWGJP_10565 [Microbacterium sp. NPDC055903]